MNQPNAIIGNSGMLCSVGLKAELFTLFYPHVDYAQNLHESMAGLHFNGKLWWTNDMEWHAEQDYFRNTNILRTRLSHPDDLEVEATDFVMPDRPLLVRNYEVTSGRDRDCRFIYYFDPHVGEMRMKNSAYCTGDEMVAYWRDLYFGLRSDPGFEEWQVGKAVDVKWWLDAKHDAEDGHLQGNDEEIGDINMAMAWSLPLKENQPRSITVYVLGARSRGEVHEGLEDLRDASYSDLLMRTQGYWVDRARTANRPINLSGRCRRWYARAALALQLLWDQEHGAFVAAPEFDPYFQQSGGYGYCWPRDAAEVASALERAGYPDIARSYYQWLLRAQLPDGRWFQRYWLNGDPAPSWCNFDHSEQLDQTASSVIVLAKHGLTRGDSDDIWPAVIRGVEYLLGRINPDTGLHESCLDLWETFPGSHTYTNASLVGALRAAADLAESRGDPRAERWRRQARGVKRAMLHELWTGDHFARRLAPDHLDVSIDACTLGVYEPFNVLDPAGPEERGMIEAVLSAVERELRVSVDEGHGILRYQGDQYIGGNPWVVTTLWLAKAQLRLAQYYVDVDPDRARELVGSARSYVEWAVGSATSVGLLSEQVNAEGVPVWVIPLGWSCALLLDSLDLLDKIKDLTGGHRC